MRIEFLNFQVDKSSGMSNQHEKLTGEIAELKKINSQLKYGIEQRDRQILDLTREIHEIKKSISWKLSWPIRIAGKPLMNLRKKIPIVQNNQPELNDYATWIKKYEKPEFIKLNIQPRISVIMPVYNPNPVLLKEAIDSVKKQEYPFWELCIADDASTDKRIIELLEDAQRKDNRIKIVYREKNGHISEASNSALQIATGEWIALMDHDDQLPVQALAFVVQAIQNNPEAAIIYSDEDKIDETGARFNPHFKSDWNPDLFFSQNYLSHLGVYRKDILDQIQGFRKGVEGSQDMDLVLRCLNHIKDHQIIHIPRILYHWRSTPNSTAGNPDSKSYTTDAGVKALRDFFNFEKSGIQVEAGYLQNTYKVDYPLPEVLPKVSLIIPTKDQKVFLENCITSILEKTSYPNFEIIVINNRSQERETLEFFDLIKNLDHRINILDFDFEFNYSSINNFGVRNSRGEIVGLVNNDVEVINEDWLTEMVRHVLRKEIGCVGAKLYYDNNQIQHAGVILGIGGVAGHSHKYMPKEDYGYFGRLMLPQNLSAVTGACMLVRKEVYQELGGLNEEDLKIAFNDVDFCLRAREKGYRNIWTPYAELYHHESISRGSDDTPEKYGRFQKEIRFMEERWGSKLRNDPYYNPNLSIITEDFSLAWPPRLDEL
jgi:O-antigen biosynthesis protein